MLLGSPCTEKVDIYSLGVTVWEVSPSDGRGMGGTCLTGAIAHVKEPNSLQLQAEHTALCLLWKAYVMHSLLYCVLPLCCKVPDMAVH